MLKEVFPLLCLAFDAADQAYHINSKTSLKEYVRRDERGNRTCLRLFSYLLRKPHHQGNQKAKRTLCSLQCQGLQQPESFHSF